MRGARLSAIALVGVMSTVVGVGQEFLQGGGFEEFGDNGVPLGWARYGGSVPESVLEPSADAHTGARSLRLLDTGPNERDGRWSVGVSQDIPAAPGQRFLASVWVKALARNHPQAVHLQLTFLPVQQSSVVDLAPPIDGKWHLFYNYAEAPPGTKSLRLYIYTMHYWTSDTLVDDASLRVATTEEMGELLPLMAWSTTGPLQVREVQREWPLVSDGNPVCAIVAPKQAGYIAAAQHLTKALATLATRTPELVLVPLPGPELRGWQKYPLAELAAKAPTLIAIGNVNNNPLCSHLYWNRYTFEDSLFPGPGAYVLRTVADPYGLSPTSSVVVIGSSDAQGAQAGVAALTELLPTTPHGRDVTLRWTLTVSNATPLDDAQRTALLTQPLKGQFVEFLPQAESYLKTGDPTYAQAAKRALLACWEAYQRDPRRSVTWPEETSSHRLGSLWAAIEASPEFTDTDRLTIARTLLVCLYSLPRHCSYWGRLADNDTIIWNHTTFPLLGIYWLTRYFQQAYPDLDPDRLALMMAEVRGAFRGQLGCWKPQCDADSYLTIVPRHLMEYTLAENDFTWFQNGNARTYAEYLSAVVDPKGIQPGFGDSSYTTATGYEYNGLPIAFWYYQDPRFLWRLNQLARGAWPNPYHQGVEPKVWNDWAGVTIFPLPGPVYHFTETRGYYDEGPAPPNVPLEQAFDKITFRENLQEDGQYLLLDGYSRGKHLHWDGNSIVKLTNHGQDWLIDGDYLVRNTTEHNMVSVLYNGRCEVQPPPCAGLLHSGVFEEAALTQTVLVDYNHTDWRRNLFWERGKWFVVLDEVEARDPGDYTMDVIWKTLRAGKQELSDGRVFTTSRWPGPKRGSYGLQTVRNPAPGVAAAVRFEEQESQLDFPLELAAGEYQITLWAQGVDTGTDSFWVQIDTGERVAFHIPIDQFGPSSASHTKDTSRPKICLAKGGRHRITITLRENPGVLLDRIVFQTAEGGTVAEVEAEAPPQFVPQELDLGPTQDFHIVGDGTTSARFVDRESNVGLKIRKLWQRTSASLASGEILAVANLLYDDTSASPLGLDIRRIDSAALITDDRGPVAVVGTRGAVAHRLDTDAAMFMVSSEKIRLVDCTRWGAWLKLDGPTDLEVNLKTNTATVHGRKVAEIKLDWNAARQAVKEVLAWCAEQAPPEPPVSPTAEVPPSEVLWEATPAEMRPVQSLRLADEIQEGALVAAIGQQVVCLSATGQTLWSWQTESTVNDLCLADLDPDGQLYGPGPEVLAALEEESLCVLSGRGELLKRRKIDYPLRVGHSSIRQPRVANVWVDDLEGDHTPDVIIGTRNGCLARLTVALEEVWVFNEIEHGTRQIVTYDLDGDGKKEILAANRYGTVEVHTADGGMLPGVYSELGDVELAIGDLEGDGSPEIVNGSSTGVMKCAAVHGTEKWRFDNHGYGVMDVEIGDWGGKSSIVVASETGCVYLLNSNGKVVAQHFLEVPVTRLALATSPTNETVAVAAGCDSGDVWFLSPQLELERRAQFGARVTAMVARGKAVWIGTREGKIAKLQ
ncbi:MAG: FG-GAP repeat domain-containing protein [Candidatus Zipacnadales bacterium]